MQLETRPSDPYSVNVWVMAAEGSVYVAAGGGRESSWAQHIAEDPRVRLRIGDAIYELRAVEADDEASRATVLAATRAKYDMSPDDDRVDDAVLYRLEPR